MPLSRQIKPPRTVRTTKNRRAAQVKSVFFTKKFICEKRANARKNEKIEDRICVNRRSGIFFPKRLDTVRKVWYTVTRKENYEYRKDLYYVNIHGKKRIR